MAYVNACCPHQALDEYTPDAWHDLLGDLDLAECRDAVVAVARRQAFVAASEIRAEVRRARDQRYAIETSERILEPVRRRRLEDPRPARESIRSILSRFGRPELVAAMPPVEPDKPRHLQLAELEAMRGTE